MEMHATSWPILSHGSMTTASGDVGITESQTDQRHSSLSNDKDFVDFCSTFNPDEHTEHANLSTTMDYAPFDFSYDNLPAHFGAINDDSHNGPLSATTNSSLQSSICDPNGAIHPFQAWPPVSNAPMMDNQQPHFQPGPWVPEHHYEQPLNLGMHGHDGLGSHMPPTSHPIENPRAMHFDGGFMDHESPISHNNGFDQDYICRRGQPEQSVPPTEDIFCGEEEREGTDTADPCYAQLLYQCLKEAPNYTLSLRELYDWVSQHSQKAKDPNNRGWQNSVRHNLSMNAAFARVANPAGSGQKKGSLWRLTDEALRDGVISTTRYRKDPKRRPERRAVPALNRQASGAKGGRATRDASRFRQQQNRGPHGLPSAKRFRRSDRNRHGAQYSPYSAHSVETSPQPNMGVPPTPHTSPYFDPHEDFNALPPLPMSAPQTPPGLQPGPGTPPELQLAYNNPAKLAPFSSYEFLPLDYSHTKLFGDHDPEMQPDANTPTPSLMTEASFISDEHLPAFGHDASREGTTFK